MSGQGENQFEVLSDSGMTECTETTVSELPNNTMGAIVGSSGPWTAGINALDIGTPMTLGTPSLAPGTPVEEAGSTLVGEQSDCIGEGTINYDSFTPTEVVDSPSHANFVSPSDGVDVIWDRNAVNEIPTPNFGSVTPSPVSAGSGEGHLAEPTTPTLCVDSASAVTPTLCADSASPADESVPTQQEILEARARKVDSLREERKKKREIAAARRTRSIGASLSPRELGRPRSTFDAMRSRGRGGGGFRSLRRPLSGSRTAYRNRGTPAVAKATSVFGPDGAAQRQQAPQGAPATHLHPPPPLVETAGVSADAGAGGACPAAPTQMEVELLAQFDAEEAHPKAGVTPAAAPERRAEGSVPPTIRETEARPRFTTP